MPSTFTQRIGLEMMAAGDRQNQWGDVLNQNVITLLDQAIAGLTSVALSSAPITLTDLDGAIDQSRSAILYLHGVLTSNCQIVVPSVQKSYVVWNACSGNFNPIVKTAGATGSAIPRGGMSQLFCDTVSVWVDGTSVGNALFTATDVSSARSAIGAGVGTITSVGISGATGIAVTGSPVTSSGSFGISLALNELTETSAISAGSDFMPIYHTSAGGIRKIRQRNLAGYFLAHKNGTDQSGIASGIESKITFPSETYDTASGYNTANSRFIPPAGEAWVLNASYWATDGNDGMFVSVVIYKNGAPHVYGPPVASGNNTPAGSEVTAIVVGNGTDYYEVYISLSNSTSSRTINGAASVSYFKGYRL